MIVFVGGDEVEVEILDYYPGCFPEISKLPEDCYPGEPAEVDYKIISDNGHLFIEERRAALLEEEILENISNG